MPYRAFRCCSRRVTTRLAGRRDRQQGFQRFWFRCETVYFGVDIFTSPSDGFFGRFNNRERISAEMR